ETDWARDGKSTGNTDIELNASGLEQVRKAASAHVGVGRLIDPERLLRCFVSPLRRAQQTLDPIRESIHCPIETCDLIREWDYGAYEGLTKTQIRELRERNGQDASWSVWNDGCPDGEYASLVFIYMSPLMISLRSVQQVTERLQKIITQIRKIQEPHKTSGHGDILIVCLSSIYEGLLAKYGNRSAMDLHYGVSSSSG
ncbi:hypothetical protein Golomagni_06599, partial [Golovinomyces magnicellulatus]